MKLAKLSLAAIMTVGAMSAANATSLEEAIQGVDMTGYGHFRFQDNSQTSKSTSESTTEIEVRALFTMPVAEDFQFVTRFTADGTSSTSEASSEGNTALGDLNFDRLMFIYTGFKNTAITYGRMYAGTPLDDTVANGLNVVYSPMTGLSLIGAYYYDNDAVSNAITALAVNYSNDMFNARAWYANTAAEADAGEANYYFLEAGLNAGPVAVKAQYVDANKEDTAGANKTYRIQATASMDMVSLRAGYTKNDDEGGDVTIDGSADGDNDLIYGGTYNLVDDSEANMESFFGEAKLSAGKFGFTAGLVGYDDSDFDYQYYGKVAYQVTKKVSTYVRAGAAEYDDESRDAKTRFRFHTQYSF